MKQSKQSIPGQSIRNFWHINPRTRVHDNDPRKNRKKLRQSSKNALKKGDFLFYGSIPNSLEPHTHLDISFSHRLWM
jgi:hypothetical protein